MLLVRHHTLLLNFTPEEFTSFRKLLGRLDFDACCAPIADGETLAVIRTPNPDICFAFSFEDWNDLKAAMDEAIYMQEIYELMK
jgi:hypothetical protein